MRAAASAGVRVPAVIEVTTVDGRPGLVMERIDGLDMLAAIARRPWLVFAAGAAAGRIQAGLNGVVAPADLPPMRAVMRQRIQQETAIPDDLKSFALSVLDTLPDGDKICHGDLHPGNIMQTAAEPVVIDWTNVTRGDPTADYVRSLLTLRISDVPPGQPWVIRHGATVARGLLISAYTRAYRRILPLNEEHIRRWEVAVAAVRIGDGIEPETPKLIALLERARSEA